MKHVTVAHGTPTDEEVAARVLAGEKDLYEIIMRRHNQRLYRISRAYVHDEDEAEDIVQQAYINAYEHLSSFEGRSRFATWLTTIAIREAMARSRKENRRVSLEAPSSRSDDDRRELQIPAEDNPEETAMNDELKYVLERTIDDLPPKYRSVFVMREIEEMSVEETSDSLGISSANVKVRLNRAKEMLKRRIGDVYHDAGVYHFDLVRCDRIVANVLTRVQRYDMRD